MSRGGVAPAAPHAEAWSRTRALATGAAAALALVACLRRINGLDYWTHLALGRAFATFGTLRIGEPFLARPGFATAPVPMTARAWYDALASGGEWPFQVAVHAVQRAAGHAGVSVAIAACGAAAAAVLVGGLLRATAVPRIAAAVAFTSAAFYLARFRFAPRPEAPAAVLLAVVLVLAFRWVERPRWAPLAGIALALALWRPLHVTWALGAALAAAAIAGGPWLAFWRRQPLALRIASAAIALVLAAWRPLHVTWALGAALAGAAIAAGPWLAFWRRQPVAVRIASAALAAAGAVAAGRFALFVLAELGRGGMLSEVTEMRPTWEFPSLAWPFAALAGAALALAWGGPEGRRPRIAVWALALVLGAVVVRNVAFAAIAMVPPVLGGLATAPARVRTAGRARAAVGVSAAVVIALLGAELRDRDYPAGVGVDFRLLPRDAAEYVVSARLETPVFNSWDWGGYLAWAWNGSPRTFLDGRLVDRASLADHDAVISGDAATIERWGFRTVVLQPLFRNSARIVPGLAWFLSNPQWKLVRAKDALVFARVPLPPGVAEVPEADAWRVILAQADALKEQNDPPPHADFTRAVALLRLGQLGSARDAYVAARRAAPENAVDYPGLAEAVGAR